MAYKTTAPAAAKKLDERKCLKTFVAVPLPSKLLAYVIPL